MEGLNAVCTETPRGEHFIFKSHLHYSAFLSSLPAFRGMNSLCQYFTQTFQKRFQFFSGSGLQVLFLSSARCSPGHPDIVVSLFVETTFKEQPWDDGMWNYCGTPLVFVACRCLFSHLLCSSLPFHNTRWKERGIVSMQEDCFHSTPIKPLWMGRKWKAFCFFSVIQNSRH